MQPRRDSSSGAFRSKILIDEVSQMRKSMIETLEMLASPAAQLTYEASLTQAGHAPTELVSIFCDDLFHPHELVHSEKFTDEELKSLAHMYGLILEVSGHRHSTVEAMLKDPLWRRVVGLAGETLGLFARSYDGTNSVGNNIFNRLDNYSGRGKRGRAFPEDTGFRCFADDPGRVRKPDGAFISFDTLPENDYEPDGFCTTVPDLIWEVVSPNDLAYELDAKIDEWLAAGVKVTWVFHPQNRTVHILRADGTSAVLRERDTLGEPSLLPGFSASVRELFGRPSRATVA